MRCKPEWETLGYGLDVLALVRLPPITARAAAARVVGDRQRDSLVGGACQQRRLPAARVARDGDMLLVYVLQGMQVIDDAVISPRPGRQSAAIVIGIGSVETFLLRIVRRNLHSAKLGEDVATLHNFRDDFRLHATPTQVAREDRRK